MTVGIARPEYLRGETGMVGGIGCSLTLDSHTVMVTIGTTAFPNGRAVKPVASIKHCTILSSGNLQRTPALL